MITFDDGYNDTYTAAYPILKTYNYNANVYVIQDTIGTTNYLSEIQADILYENNWDIANHGQNHTHLTQVDASLQKAIVQEGQEGISDMGFTRSAYHFAFPFGNRNGEVISSAKEVGTLTARSTRTGTLF